MESGFGGNKAHVVDHVMQFWATHNKLSTENDLVLYGSRIMIPLSARRKILWFYT